MTMSTRLCSRLRMKSSKGTCSRHASTLGRCRRRLAGVPPPPLRPFRCRRPLAGVPPPPRLLLGASPAQPPASRGQSRGQLTRRLRAGSSRRSRSSTARSRPSSTCWTARTWRNPRRRRSAPPGRRKRVRSVPRGALRSPAPRPRRPGRRRRCSAHEPRPRARVLNGCEARSQSKPNAPWWARRSARRSGTPIDWSLPLSAS